jgi:hypothetical protein
MAQGINLSSPTISIGFLMTANRLATRRVCCKTVDAMRILALDHGSKRIGVAVSDETKTIAQPLEYILAEPFADFLVRG